MHAEVPAYLEYDELYADISFQDEVKRELSLRSRNDQYFSVVPPNLLQRLNKGSAAIQIHAKKEKEIVADSNYMLIINLLDIRTGQNVRRERLVKEAYQNVSGFFQMLKSLMAENDSEALIAFLTYCDIPFLDSVSPRIFRAAKVPWSFDMGMRSLGDRNLKIFTDLHDLVVDFYRRHCKKLERHIKGASLRGMGNFLHILLAAAGVLRSQLERAICGFEAQTSPLDPSEWFTCRDRFNSYLSYLLQLLKCFSDDYLGSLEKSYKIKDIRAQSLPDLDVLVDLYSNLGQVRERLELVRNGDLKVVNNYGQKLVPPYSDYDIFSNNRWTQFKNELEQLINDLKSFFNI